VEPVRDATGFGTPTKHLPAVLTFGGDDGARHVHDDLRRLELHGLAAEPLMHHQHNPLYPQHHQQEEERMSGRATTSTTRRHQSSSSSAAAMLPVEMLRRDRCQWRLLHNSTADRAWMDTCMASTSPNATSPSVPLLTNSNASCSLADLLQRAWCQGEYQSVGYL
jgi:hypothetical protein